MKTCPNCNVQLDDAATFCANCGARISESAQAQPQYTQKHRRSSAGRPLRPHRRVRPAGYFRQQGFCHARLSSRHGRHNHRAFGKPQVAFHHVPCQTGTQIHGCQHSHAYMRSASFLDDNRSCCIRRYELYISCSQSYLLLPDLLGQSQRACNNPQPRLP